MVRPVGPQRMAPVLQLFTNLHSFPGNLLDSEISGARAVEPSPTPNRPPPRADNIQNTPAIYDINSRISNAVFERFPVDL